MAKGLDYKWDHYFPNFEGVKTDTLVALEIENRNKAEQLRLQADGYYRTADEYLWELNFRKHIKTLKPLLERETEVHRLINDPATKKTAKRKLESESDKLHKAIWRIMKYGRVMEV